ncbi:MAG: hypothetical protein GF364_14695 [Candidatus Lokiarchaeota archaeon]|nr:hypothetical protein [Candidatus Lokiarchaeota archaeon]
MKTKFLDSRNCHTILPYFGKLPFIRKLDDCLTGINKSPGKLSGSIDALINKNVKTINRLKSSKRLFYSPIDIAQNANIQNRVIQTVAHTSPQSPYAQFHLSLQFENGIIWKTIIPLQFLLKGWGDANKGYQCYIHTIAQHMDKISSLYDLKARSEHASDEYYYVGITSRNWLTRISEHMGEMNRGSRKRFHSAWRESLGLENVLFISILMELNMTFEDAMNWEEKYVDKIANDRQGLNMIPGGFKGISYLHKLRVINRTNITLEERDEALERYIHENPRRGIPNPFISELWKDNDYYLKVIEARPKTLSADQVKKIRKLNAEGMTAAEIVDEVKALNLIQVKNVLAGKTYMRID